MSYSTVENDGDRCPLSKPNPSTVEDHEDLARILHSTICDGGMPSEKTFQIEDLTLARPNSGADWDCGNSGGVSVQRTPPSTPSELWQKSVQLAAAKPNRTPHGAALARASDLRKIRIEQMPGQVVFVLQDGDEKNAGHAVIRMDQTIPDGLRKKVREKIIAAS